MPIRCYLLFFSLYLSSISFLTAQPNIQIQEIADGFGRPLDIAHAGDERLFVVEQRGVIMVIDENRNVLPTPFLDIQNIVSDDATEKGLLGLAFHPDYAENGLFFVNYTRGLNTIIARYSVSDNPNIADSNSEVVLLTVEQPFSNHNGGCMKFGADGFLYIGMGDGGSGGDPRNFSQNPSSLLGKMLRIEVGEADTYSIPADNPFINDAETRDEIWAFGLRNPWRFSFDRLTSDLWIGDVGQNKWEEVSFLAADAESGANFGWRCFEGFEAFSPDDCADHVELIPPAHVYQTAGPDGRSITGGFVYRGTQQPSLVGHYLYGDYVSTKIFSITQDENGNWMNRELLRANVSMSSFGEDVNGELYMAGHQTGKVYQILDDQTTSTNFPTLQEPIIIFPNPTKNFVKIESVDNFKSKATISLYNANGELVFERFVEQLDSETIPLREQGIYFLQIRKGQQSWMKKIVKYP